MTALTSGPASVAASAQPASARTNSRNRAVAVGREGNAAGLGELLRDISANPAEKDFIRRDAAAAVEFIEEALRVAEAQAQHRCQRCGATVTADAFARSSHSFQRVFCDRCFDEVFLERRNFETQVELNKTIEARDGTVVQSSQTWAMPARARSRPRPRRSSRTLRNTNRKA